MSPLATPYSPIYVTIESPDEVNVVAAPPAQVNVESELASFTLEQTVINNQNAVYVHTQASAASVWTVTHNLGYFPNVRVVIDGSNVTADIDDVNDNQLLINHDAARSGVAYLS